MTIVTSATEHDTPDAVAAMNAQHSGIEVPCLHGYVAKTYQTAEDIPREIAHGLLLEHIASQGEVYERNTGVPIDPRSHITSFWANINMVLPPQGSYYLVWSNQGELVGTSALRRVDESTGEMKHLYVSPKARGSGLGRWLVEQRLRDARALGLNSVIADTVRGNVEMPALYAKLGFEEIEPNQNSTSVAVMPHLINALLFYRMQL
jgi:GNAT superfamily N-acetyltransferase